ncbi:hypothetical protein Trydic_g4778 [Trypoxylus dichotomus]
MDEVESAQSKVGRLKSPARRKQFQPMKKTFKDINRRSRCQQQERLALMESGISPSEIRHLEPAVMTGSDKN